MGEMPPAFLELLIDSEYSPEMRSRFKLMESLLILLAGEKGSNQAKVATEMANKWY